MNEHSVDSEQDNLLYHYRKAGYSNPHTLVILGQTFVCPICGYEEDVSVGYPLDANRNSGGYIFRKQADGGFKVYYAYGFYCPGKIKPKCTGFLIMPNQNR